MPSPIKVSNVLRKQPPRFWDILLYIVPIIIAVSVALWIFSIPVMRISKQVEKQKAYIDKLYKEIIGYQNALDEVKNSVDDIQNYTAADSDQLNAKLRKLSGDIYLIDEKMTDQIINNEKDFFQQEKSVQEMRLQQKLLNDKIEKLTNELNDLRRAAASEPKVDVELIPDFPQQ